MKHNFGMKWLKKKEPEENKEDGFEQAKLVADRLPVDYWLISGAISPSWRK